MFTGVEFYFLIVTWDLSASRESIKRVIINGIFVVLCHIHLIENFEKTRITKLTKNNTEILILNTYVYQEYMYKEGWFPHIHLLEEAKQCF